MSHPPKASVDSYYRRIMSGVSSSQQDRIMKYFLMVGRPATRHECVDNYFYTGYPPRSLDGGKPIPWQSATGAIAVLKKGGYLQVESHGKDPVTDEPHVEFLTPVGDKWAQRNLF